MVNVTVVTCFLRAVQVPATGALDILVVVEFYKKHTL
jgi:hypothetical protein